MLNLSIICSIRLKVLVTTFFFSTGVYTSFTEHCKTESGDSQLPDLVNYDEYDANVFRNHSAGHSALKGFPPKGSGFRRVRSEMEMQRMAKSVSRDELMIQRVSPPKGVSSYEELEMSSSSTMLMVSSDLDSCDILRIYYYSGPPSLGRLH